MGVGMMGFGLLMMFLGLLVIAAVIAILVWAVIYFTGARTLARRAGRSSAPDPRSALRER